MDGLPLLFSSSMLPSSRQIASAAEKLLILEDWHSFGPDYDPTLLAWHHNFVTHWDQVKAACDGRFFRMWTYYLLACAGSFRARRNQLWQIVFSRDGLRPGYVSVRQAGWRHGFRMKTLISTEQEPTGPTNG